MSMTATINDLKTLFDEAKQQNEFEFVWSLINFKGMGSAQVMASLHEWFEALNEYKGYYQNYTGKSKTRMAALFYSSFFENSDFYNIIGSLARIKLGYAGSSFLYWKTRKYERLLGIGEKQDFVKAVLADAGKNHINDFFEQVHYPEIRNSFFHSAYSLEGDDYIMHDSDPITIGSMQTTSFDVQQFFYPLVDKLIVFFDAFQQLYTHHWLSYRQDVPVGANRLGATAIIIGTPTGLGGVKIPNAVVIDGQRHFSGVWYDHTFKIWMAINIVLNIPAIEQLEISDNLARYEKKGKVIKGDAFFGNLIDKIVERNETAELDRAVNLYIILGDNKAALMDGEQNEFKKKSMPAQIIPLYKKAIELNKDRQNLLAVEARIKEIEKAMV